MPDDVKLDNNIILPYRRGGVLPDSRPRISRGAKQFRNGGWWIPIFCANCGADGGMVPEENCDFAFYLCNPCWEKHGEIAGTMAVPDEIFWAEVAAEQAALNKSDDH